MSKEVWLSLSLFGRRNCRYVKRRVTGSGGAAVLFWLLHQLCLVYICNPALQLLRMFREKLEFGAITFRMLPRVVIANLSWRKEQKKLNIFTDIQG